MGDEAEVGTVGHLTEESHEYDERHLHTQRRDSALEVDLTHPLQKGSMSV